jgi:hypothetical protein
MSHELNLMTHDDDGVVRALRRVRAPAAVDFLIFSLFIRSQVNKIPAQRGNAGRGSSWKLELTCRGSSRSTFGSQKTLYI